MKKFLSLVLALVMTMSLVTISAGAKDFTDADKVNYDEAIAVLSAVKVIDGYTDGSFKPQTQLNRGQAAKIICNLVLGPTTAAELSATVAPFSDVPANNIFAGYITYCANEGIICGYGDGTFRPTGSLTGYAFMKMLLGALGYDADIEGYNNPGSFGIQVAKQAIGIGLNKGLKDTFNGNKTVTREEACLYALNTLKATMVEYDQKIVANVNGAQITVGTSLANEVEWNIASKTDGNIKDDDYVQFAEKYFPNLELETGYGIYGRPTNVWKLKKVEIGSYTSIEPTYVYTEATENQDVYKDLGKAVIDQTGKKEDLYTWTAFVNGKEVDDVVYPINKDAGKVAKDDDYEYTGNGAVTEIYVDDDAQTVTVCEINYYLGQVSKVKDKTITVKALSKEPKLDDKTFEVEGYEEDDYVVFTVDFNDDEDFVIGEVIEPATVTGEVVRVENDKNTGDAYIKLEDGSKHPYSGTNHIVYDLDGTLNEKVHPELTEDYILYLDPNGFVLGFEKAEDTVDQYLYVQDSDEELHDWVAKVVLPDATNPKVDLKNKYKPVKGDDVKISWVNEKGEPVGTTTGKSNIDETVWAYTASDKGVYTLKEVAKENIYKSEDKKAEIHNGKAYITEGEDNLIVDKKTVFVDVDGEKAYTGYKEVPNIENATVVAVVKDKVAKIVFVLEGDIYDENSTYFMLLKNTRESLKYDGDYYWEYSKAYVNGEKTSLTVAYDADKDAKDTVLETGVLYKALKSIEDGKYITHVEKVKLANLPVNAVGDDAFWLTVNPTKTVKYDCDENTVFVLVEYTDKGKLDTISAGNIGDMFVGKDDDGFQTLVSVVKDANDHNTARLVYITYMKPAVTGTLTINGEAVGTYNEGDTFTYTYKATEGKKITAVTGEGFTYTIAADGKSATITGKMTKAGITVTVTEETVVGKVTLTLTGKLVNATVWSTDGKNEYTGTETKEFGEVVSKSFQIPENTTVTIVDKDITAGKMDVALTTEDVTLGDTDVDIKNGTKVAITVDGKTNYITKGAQSPNNTVPAANGKYLEDVKNGLGKNTVEAKNGKLTVSDTSKGHEYYVAYPVDALEQFSGLKVSATYEGKAVKSYVAKGETIELTFGADGSYAVQIDGKTVGEPYYDVKAGTKATVEVTGAVTVIEVQSEKQFKADVASKTAGVTSKTTEEYTLTVAKDRKSATLVIASGKKIDDVHNTGIGTAAKDLLNAGYTIKAGKYTFTKDNSISNGELNAAALKAMKELIPTVDPLVDTEDKTETLTITVSNATGASEVFTVTVTQKV